MGREKLISLVIISKYFVPHKVVDSDAVYNMAVSLLKRDPNLNIQIVTTNSKYKSELFGDKYDPEILNKLKINYIKELYSQKDASIKKFIFGLFEGFLLVKKAKSLKIKNIISLSNPPLIAMWGSILLKKTNYFYWTFDLYPEAFGAEKILVHHNFLYKLFQFFTYRNSPKALIALGDKQYDFLTNKYKNHNIKKIILPCGIHDEKKIQTKPSWFDEEKIILGYIGNVGRAHSKDFLLNIIELMNDKQNFKLILSIYGYYSEEIISFIEINKPKNVFFVKPLSQSQLSYIDINLVSLKDEWTNVSVPSKAVSAICSESLLWFCGSKNSDTWNMFKECSYTSNSCKKSLIETFSLISKQDVLNKKEVAGVLKNDLLHMENDAFDKIISSLIN
jgi:hypothetical protein